MVRVNEKDGTFIIELKVQTKREQEIMMELKDMDVERRLQEGAESSKKKPGLDDAFDGRNWESMDTEDKSTPFD